MCGVGPSHPAALVLATPSLHLHSFSVPSCTCPSPLTLYGPFPPDVLEHQHVAQLLRRFSSDCSTSRTISLDATLAHHLQQCSYHLRLFRSWLISGQDDLECLYGTARCSCLCPVLL